MNLVMQKHEKDCGQASLAMILGVSLDEAWDLVGHGGYTSTKDLVRVLRKSGTMCADGLVPLRSRTPGQVVRTCIVRRPDRRRKTHWHWIVYHDCFYYNPDFPIVVEAGSSSVNEASFSSVLPVYL